MIHQRCFSQKQFEETPHWLFRAAWLSEAISRSSTGSDRRRWACAEIQRLGLKINWGNSALYRSLNVLHTVCIHCRGEPTGGLAQVTSDHTRLWQELKSLPLVKYFPASLCEPKTCCSCIQTNTQLVTCCSATCRSVSSSVRPVHRRFLDSFSHPCYIYLSLCTSAVCSELERQTWRYFHINTH